MAVYRVAGRSVVRIDASAGGTLVAITAYVKEIDGFGREYDALDDTHFDDAVERVIPDIELGQEFTLRGAFEDTATTGPDAILSTAVGTLLTFEFNPVGTAAGARRFTSEVFVRSYKVMGEVKGQLNYEARLKQDGAVTVGTA
jgi:hypothetical protein